MANDIKKDPYVRSPKYELGLTIMMFFTVGMIMLDKQLPLYLGSYLLTDLNMSNAQLGGISTAMGIGWGVSALIFGTFSDTVGRRKIVVPGMIILSILSACTGIVGSYVLLLGVRLMMGIVEGPVCALCPGIVSEESKPSRRGFNTGLVMSSGSLIGSFVAPVMGVGIAEAIGWRPAFFIIGIPGLLIGLIMAKFLREPPSTATKLAKAKAGQKEKYDFKGVLRYRNVWIAGIAFAFFGGSAGLWYSYAPLFMLQIKGIEPGTMSWIMGACGWGNFVWMLIAPGLSDKLGRKPTMILLALCSIILPVTILRSSSVLAMMIVAAVGACYAGMATILTAVIPTETVHPKLIGSALGINHLFSEILGSAFLVLIAGIVADHFGYTAVMYMYIAEMVAIAIMSCFLKETAPGVLARRGIITEAEQATADNKEAMAAGNAAVTEEA